MEPIFGMLLYLVATIVVAVVAGKRGRSWVLYGIGVLAAGPVLARLIYGAGGSSMAAGFGAFAAPAVGLGLALMVKSGEQLATERGSFGDHKKCPYCAESVRLEAIKCKHCGSQLPA